MTAEPHPVFGDLKKYTITHNFPPHIRRTVRPLKAHRRKFMGNEVTFYDLPVGTELVLAHSMNNSALVTFMHEGQPLNATIKDGFAPKFEPL